MTCYASSGRELLGFPNETQSFLRSLYGEMSRQAYRYCCNKISVFHKAFVRPFLLVVILHDHIHPSRIRQHYHFVHKVCILLASLDHDIPHSDHLLHPRRVQKLHHDQS